MPDYIVCLEDGKKFKSLKRHLRTHYDLTPEQYRAEVGPARRLSDGRAELRQGALGARQGNGARTEARALEPRARWREASSRAVPPSGPQASVPRDRPGGARCGGSDHRSSGLISPDCAPPEARARAASGSAQARLDCLPASSPGRIRASRGRSRAPLVGLGAGLQRLCDRSLGAAPDSLLDLRNLALLPEIRRPSSSLPVSFLETRRINPLRRAGIDLFSLGPLAGKTFAQDLSPLASSGYRKIILVTWRGQDGNPRVTRQLASRRRRERDR